MPVADTKKVQTMLNIVGQQAQIVRDAVQTMNDVRTAFNAVNPDTTGTPLEGNAAIVSNAIDALDTEASKAVWTQMIAAIVDSHRNEAL